MQQRKGRDMPQRYSFGVAPVENPAGAFVKADDWQEEHDIVDRIWEIYGSPSYESLGGKSIYDLIEADRRVAEAVLNVLKDFGPNRNVVLNRDCGLFDLARATAGAREQQVKG